MHMAEQQVRELEGKNCDLQRQVQQAQEQVSSVMFHHTCTVCSVCRWLLLCPHTHMQLAGEEQPHWVVRREEVEMTTEELGKGGWGVANVAKLRGQRVSFRRLSLYNGNFFRTAWYRERYISPTGVVREQLFDRIHSGHTSLGRNETFFVFTVQTSCH